MHPAMSATIATTGAGLASGLLVLLGLIAPGDEVPKTAGFGILAFALAIGGIVVALVHSAGSQGVIPGAPAEHLNWLARTRFLLLLNLIPTALFGFGWLMFGTVDGLWRGAGLTGATIALLTLVAHARVYVAVPTVAAWHNRWVVLNFVAIGLLAGSLWLNCLVHIFGTGNPQIALLSVVAVFFVFYVKRGHWREIDRSQAKLRVLATGPGEDHGDARPSFYVPPERTRRLRRLAFIFLLAVPLLLELVGMGKPSGLATLFALGAALSGTAGIVIERWLFFTDAPTSGANTETVDLLT
jgi:DMSO reductase anchor subunit